jgi:hypothetical protein
MCLVNKLLSFRGASETGQIVGDWDIKDYLCVQVVNDDDGGYVYSLRVVEASNIENAKSVALQSGFMSNIIASNTVSELKIGVLEVSGEVTAYVKDAV